MPRCVFAAIMLSCVATAATRADEKPKPGYAKKDGLSLRVKLEKKVFRPTDGVKLAFTLKNETEKDMFIGDGHLAPDYHEAGPRRHFEVLVTHNKKSELYFWSGLATEGRTSGVRNVFKLKPGETYEGFIRISPVKEKGGGPAKEADGGTGGSFEDKTTRKKHVLGKDGKKYSVALRYQVDPKTHSVWKPPDDFKETILWKGELVSSPIKFKIARE